MSMMTNLTGTRLPRIIRRVREKNRRIEDSLREKNEVIN